MANDKQAKCEHPTTALAENWDDRYCAKCGKWLGKQGEFLDD